MSQMLTTTPIAPNDPSEGSYGLGLATFSTPCGTVWGYLGGTAGQDTTAPAAQQFTLAARNAREQLICQMSHRPLPQSDSTTAKAIRTTAGRGPE
jgi:hypothetical protein